MGKLSPAFQSQFCGGPLDRFDCLTFKLTTAKSVARGGLIWSAIAVVALLVIWWAF